MELQHLRSFLEVSSELSFTRAAKKLNYAQSSVTAQIQHLEASLGAVLFDRRGRRISLTESGQRLRPVAERIVALADLAQREVAGAADRQTGRRAERDPLGRPDAGPDLLGRPGARPALALPAQRGPVRLPAAGRSAPSVAQGSQQAPRAGSSTSQADRTRVIRSNSSRTDPR
jgi:molybdenum-dependent DNA-binding transcriptional regulator ModE